METIRPDRPAGRVALAARSAAGAVALGLSTVAGLLAACAALLPAALRGGPRGRPVPRRSPEERVASVAAASAEQALPR
jgi:hypothetical protein